MAPIFLAFIGSPARAQTSGADGGGGFWPRWFERSDRSKAEQPHWLTPLATTTPRLEQEFRYDVNWAQARPGTAYTEVYGNTKGLELIPADPVEIIIAVPAYVVHNNPAVANGWGDSQLLLKYRLLSANEQRGDYIVTAFVSSSFPTGTHGNGQPKAIVTPTIAYGKGWGGLDVQGTFGAAEPLADVSAIGRSYIWNHTFQIHPSAKVWPELETSRTWFVGGKNAGREQTLLTPGVVYGRTRLTERLGLTVGAGVQIAVSRFHTTNHTFIVTSRLPF